MKLSIIIPVYNVEKYIRKCVDSLLAQDYTDYEIILVDDGSTDNSGAICDEFASPSFASLHHSIIKTIHQPNGGLSAARNSGIKAANGEYLCFVDSDDYWEPNVLGDLMERVERDNLDVLRFNYQNVNERYEVFHPNKNPKRDVNYSTTVTDGETFLNARLGPACYAVMFIIRRDLIIEEQSSNIIHNTLLEEHHTSYIIHNTFEKDSCLFKEGIFFEDTDWTPRMLLRAKRVASTPKIVYNYLWRSGSITMPTDPTKREKVIRDKIALLDGFKEQQMLVKDPMWFKWMTSFNTMSILGMLMSLPSNERKAYIDELKLLHVFPLSTIRTDRNERIKIWIANMSPYLYCTLMSLRK